MMNSSRVWLDIVEPLVNLTVSGPIPQMLPSPRLGRLTASGAWRSVAPFSTRRIDHEDRPELRISGRSARIPAGGRADRRRAGVRAGQDDHALDARRLQGRRAAREP